MKTYQLRSRPEIPFDTGMKTFRVYLRSSVFFFRAAAERRGVRLNSVETKEGFDCTLSGDPDAVAAVLRDFNTRPL
jgi:hypothetical protein